MVLLLGLTGPRIGEPLELEVADLDFLRRRVRITKAVSEVRGQVVVGSTKTGGSRGVALPPVVVETLAAHLAAFPTGSRGLLFPDSDGGVQRRTNWRRRVWLPA